MKALKVSKTTTEPFISFLANIVTTNDQMLNHIGALDGESTPGDKYYIALFIGEEGVDKYPLYVAATNATEADVNNGIYEVSVKKTGNTTINPSSLRTVMRDKDIARVVLTNESVEVGEYTAYGCKVKSTVSRTENNTENSIQDNIQGSTQY